ncbi:MAG: hypothetical protein QW735_02365 [archaeon]
MFKKETILISIVVFSLVILNILIFAQVIKPQTKQCYADFCIYGQGDITNEFKDFFNKDHFNIWVESKGNSSENTLIFTTGMQLVKDLAQRNKSFTYLIYDLTNSSCEYFEYKSGNLSKVYHEDKCIKKPESPTIFIAFPESKENLVKISENKLEFYAKSSQALYAEYMVLRGYLP